MNVADNITDLAQLLKEKYFNLKTILLRAFSALYNKVKTKRLQPTLHTGRFLRSKLLIIALVTSAASWAQGGLDSPVNYQARDSIVADFKEQIVRLYGEATVEYTDFTLAADYIEIDLRKKEVIATYTTSDTTDSLIGKPVFMAGDEEGLCEYIKYNFDTKTGYIREVRGQQDEGYIHMAEAKYHPNEEIHLKDGKFTTCDKEKPHYHFRLTRAIVVPDKRIVTGPVYMKLFKIPMPLAAPFAMFPNSEERKNGIILPSYGRTPQYGFGLQNLGWYMPLGEMWDTRIYGTIYSTGRFGLENVTAYYKKYKLRGEFGVKFEQFRGRFYDTTVVNKWTVRWKHSQDAKAHPSIRFNTDINFKSDNNGKTSLQPVNGEYFDNQFNSAVNVSKTWRAGQFSGTGSVKASLQQNSVSKLYSLDLPSFNLSVARFDLGVLRGNSPGESFLDKITVTYSMNARNMIQAPDSLFTKDYYNMISDFALNGVQHNTVLQSNLQLFRGRMTFTPNVTYKELWNFQYADQLWNPVAEKVDTVKQNGFLSSREISGRAGIVTNFYGYYKMLGKKKIRFRHVASPNVSISFRPDIGLWQPVQTDTTGTSRYYSPFQNSLYKEPGYGNSAVMQFGVTNILEMKRKNQRDTVNNSDKTNKLIDALSFDANYDFLKDTSKLSDISIQFRTAKFLKVFNFQSSAVHSPYAHNSEGKALQNYAWQTGQGIGRMKTGTVAVTANFTNKAGRNKQKENDSLTSNNAVQNAFATMNKPDFSIPWQLNLSYNLNYTRSSIKVAGLWVDTSRLVQTLRADGDFNINKKWKVGVIAAYDLQAGAFTNYNISLWRDLHCWEATLLVGQIGKWAPDGNWQSTNITFLFRVNIKASMFQDIKLEFNQPPFFN